MTRSRCPAAAYGLVVSMLLLYGGIAGAHAEPAAKPAHPPASQPAAATCNTDTYRVVIDVGHTEKVPGAKGARGVYEYTFNLRLAKVIEKDLIAAGFIRTALMITAEPPYRGLLKRVVHAGGLSADLFLSIHHDSVPDSMLETWEYEGQQQQFSDRFRGHSIFVSNGNAQYAASLQFARLLGLQLKARGMRYTPHYTLAIMGHRRRQLVDAEAGVYRYDQLVVLKGTRMPAALLEAGSIINRDEELLMATPERQALISAAVTDAVKEFCTARAQQAPRLIARRPPASSAPRPHAHPAAARAPSGHRPSDAY